MSCVHFVLGTVHVITQGFSAIAELLGGSNR